MLVAGTISHYLKLSVVDAIHLPLPINFIFIGFGGEGNQGSPASVSPVA